MLVRSPAVASSSTLTILIESPSRTCCLVLQHEVEKSIDNFDRLSGLNQFSKISWKYSGLTAGNRFVNGKKVGSLLGWAAG